MRRLTRKRGDAETRRSEVRNSWFPEAFFTPFFPSPFPRVPPSRNAHDPVFDEHGIAQTRADAHEHRRDEVREKRIGKARTRKRRIFRRKVLTIDKARDDAEMEGEIAIVIQYTGVKALRFLQ